MKSKHFNVVPRTDAFLRATYCSFFFGCQQAAGELHDSMGGPSANKFDASYTDAEAWANAGYLTTGNSAVTDYMTRPATPTNSWDSTQRCAILALRLKKATPGSNEVIAGCFTSGSANGGWQIIATSTGTLQLQMKPLDGGSASTITISSIYPTLDGAEHLAMWAIPRSSGASAQMFVDGLLVATSGMAAAVNNFAGGNALNIGASLGGSAKAAQFATIQLYTIARDLGDIKTTQIADWIARNPHLPVPDWLMEA